jgi:YfiH family protein
VVELLKSALLAKHGFVHGFATRIGGVSAAPFDALNLGRSVGDDPDAVAENSRRFLATLGSPELFEASQVHGSRVLAIGPNDRVAAVRAEEADALITTRGAVGVRTADCIPILFGDRETGAVAAVHAGWRGVASAIAIAAVEHLRAGGIDPKRLVAAIGPHIRGDAFEVGPEVVTALAPVAFGADYVVHNDPKPYVDLARVVRAQLAHAGVADVDDVGGCTLTEPARFYSHRRDRGRTGRHLSAIVARA